MGKLDNAKLRTAAARIVLALSLMVVIWPATGYTQPGPVVDIWYGDSQDFGLPGMPQRFVDILGNVSNPDGVSSLVYKLNGGASTTLSIGPDSRRLESTGDFCIDISRFCSHRRHQYGADNGDRYLGQRHSQDGDG